MSSSQHAFTFADDRPAWLRAAELWAVYGVQQAAAGEQSREGGCGPRQVRQVLRSPDPQHGRGGHPGRLPPGECALRDDRSIPVELSDPAHFLSRVSEHKRHVRWVSMSISRQLTRWLAALHTSLTLTTDQQEVRGADRRASIITVVWQPWCCWPASHQAQRRPLW